MNLAAYIILIIIAAASYLIGSVNFSVILSRAIGGKDIRKSGSGNAGATNMLRTYGKKMGVITLILDIIKGIVCVLIAILLTEYISAPERYSEFGRSDLQMLRSAVSALCLPYIAGVCVVLGHNFPVFFGFKGGKGVATSLGVVLILDWKIGLIAAVCAIAVIAITSYVSLGSIVGGAVFMIAELIKMAVTDTLLPVRVICVIVLGGLLILRHRTNIKRLINGTENKLGAKKENENG